MILRDKFFFCIYGHQFVFCDNKQGYLVGNPVTGESIDFDSRVPYAHGVGIISDQLYEVIK